MSIASLERRRRWIVTALAVLALSLLVVFVAAAVPVFFTWRSYDSNGSTAYGVYNSDNATPLQYPDILHLIYVGPDGVISPPAPSGMPSGDDQLLITTTIYANPSLPPPLWNHGYFSGDFSYDSETWPDGTQVYVRAFNAPGNTVTAYGDSAIGTLTALGEYTWPRWYTNHAWTAIELKSFTAQSSHDRITVRWETVSELDTAGFNVLRSETEAGGYTQLNAELIPAEGGPTQGASYAYEDVEVTRGVTYYYKLEEVDTEGESTLYGPVWATAGVSEVNLPLVIK